MTDKKNYSYHKKLNGVGQKKENRKEIFFAI